VLVGKGLELGVGPAAHRQYDSSSS
jgi:hypothetical protein